jgi:steroid 5-alpha reductase family enzyme
LTVIQLTISALVVTATMSAIMALAWLVQRRTGNSGWVDVSWSLGVGAVSFLIALLPMHSVWPHWRQLTMAVLVLCWCLRLGLHIAQRTQVAVDDPRYRDLIEKWGADASRRLFWFLQAQAAVGGVLVLSIALAAHNANPALRVADIIGAVILLGGIAGEATGDRQLRQFKADPANRGQVCDVGLWHWSRHPNYFFEWVFWVGVAVIAVDVGGYNLLGWLGLAAPVCMYWVLVHASGIPPLETHMLRSRGEKYREYQQRTPAFFPAPPAAR